MLLVIKSQNVLTQLSQYVDHRCVTKSATSLQAMHAGFVLIKCPDAARYFAVHISMDNAPDNQVSKIDFSFQS